MDTSKDKAHLDSKITELIENIGSTFEFYLPDEKISATWQDTEIISTQYPEFEARCYERELEDGSLYISSDYEFFPCVCSLLNNY